MDSSKSKHDFKGRHFKKKKKVFAITSSLHNKHNVTKEVEPIGEKELKELKMSTCMKDIRVDTSYSDEVVDIQPTHCREGKDNHIYWNSEEIEKVEIQNIIKVKIEDSNLHSREEDKKGIDHIGEDIMENNSTTEIVADLTQEFNRIFKKRYFQSFSEFEKLFIQFKEETGSVFRIQKSCSVEYENSRRKKYLIPEGFKFASIKYCCVHYGQPKITGVGVRSKKQYLPSGCNCLLSLGYNRGGLFISYVNMLHNHHVSSQMAPSYAINRHIDNNELQEIADDVDLMPSSRALQQYLIDYFERPITLQDAKNVRARITRLKSLQSVIKTEKQERDSSIMEENGENAFEEIDTLEIQKGALQEGEIKDFYKMKSPEMEESGIEIELGESGNINNIKRIKQESHKFEEFHVTDDISCDKSNSHTIHTQPNDFNINTNINLSLAYEAACKAEKLKPHSFQRTMDQYFIANNLSKINHPPPDREILEYYSTKR